MKKKCPKCGKLKGVPIVYSLPTLGICEESRKKKYHLGGCMITGNSYKWHCKNCDHEWDPVKLVK